MTIPLVSQDRPCPTCGKTTHEPYISAKLDPERFSGFTFASRKEPEFMCFPMVKCLGCSTVYTPRPPIEGYLAKAYGNALYDSPTEAQHAATTYAELLAEIMPPTSIKGAAVDIGAGNGALLSHFQKMGFTKVIGVEPSKKAIESSPDEVRPLLIEAVFTPALLKGEKVGLISICQTIEHVSNPTQLLETAHDVLVTGGMVAVVAHDYSALLNRILGSRSPIVDVEHLQLFNSRSMTHALQHCGFDQIQVQHFSNRYPLNYWIRLLPLPSKIKKRMMKICQKMNISSKLISLPVGNMIATGIKV